VSRAALASDSRDPYPLRRELDWREGESMSIRSFCFGLTVLALAAGMAPAAQASTLRTPLFDAGSDSQSRARSTTM
jgi:hypothetical protein